ncbi:tubulin-folding cofactor B isoform X2 [Sminthopsis crassicaudata]|uniref:tubulin-folding cofactor B isoform X2 n=1 Tax=Sminthopsis crassicaudata TaxID=9301 RepID=UPI003D693076
MNVAGVSAPTVTVFISSSLNSFRSEKRYNRGLTLAEFKCKLELVVGSPASCMDLELYTADDRFCMKLDQDDALLGSYPVDDGCRIHVIDRSGARLGEYEDLSQVEKFELSQSAYESRTARWANSMRRSRSGGRPRRPSAWPRRRPRPRPSRWGAAAKCRRPASPPSGAPSCMWDSRISSLATGLVCVTMSRWGNMTAV